MSIVVFRDNKNREISHPVDGGKGGKRRKRATRKVSNERIDRERTMRNGNETRLVGSVWFDPSGPTV